MDSQIYVDNNLIHPETNSNIVIHNNSNLKNFLNGLVSTDNMPAFMQSFLMSQNYIQANQALKTIPETYFDYAFNKWTVSGAPALSNGIATFDGNDYLQCTPGWTIGGSNDFTVYTRVKCANTGANNPIFCAINTNNTQPISQLQFSSDNKIAWNHNPSSSPKILYSAVLSANSWYYVEISFDSSDNTRRLFIDGQLADSITQAHSSLKTLRIGTNYGAANGFLQGSIDFIQISDCVRHTSNFTPAAPTFDDNTLSLLLFD